MFTPRIGQIGRIARTAAALVLGAVLALGSLLALSNPAEAHSAPRTRLLVSDNMRRHVPAGLGTARRGGHYAVSALRGARVQHHRAILGPVRPGRSISAWLPHSRSGDTHVRTSFHLGSHAALGGGEYFDIGLRRASDGTSYLAKVRVVPSGVLVGLSRVRNGRETMLGGERRVLSPSAAHGWIDIDAVVEGSYPVDLAMRVWRSGQATPKHFQVTYTDRSAARLDHRGSVGFTSYLSRTASGASTVDFRHVRVWQDLRRTLSFGTTPPRTTTPVKPTPITTPPVSTPPVSTPPVTTPPVTTPPAGGTTTGTAGAAPLGSTDYPIPAGAVFVSPTGDDSAAGTQSNPVRTLARALTVAPNGGTVVMRAGSYHESVNTSKTLTVENYPGEVVWLDGSTAVTDWTQQGNTWVHTGWTANFNSVPSYTGTISSAPGWSFTNAAHPMAAHPDQMWINGQSLAQVGSASAVVPGTFYADYADDELVIGNDPTGAAVRASDLQVALSSYAPNFTIRGIGVRNYATSVNQFGALRMCGTSATVENVVSTQNATTGIMLGAANPTVRNVTVSNNGMLGLTGTYVNGLVVDGLLASGNNTEGFSQSPVSGGMKIARTRGVTVRNSTFEDNTGPGAWFDESVYNATVVNNVMKDNAGHGMSYEISSTALIANNLVQGNGGWGIKINDSDSVRAWNNSVLGNGAGGIWVAQDTRRGANLSDPGHNPKVAQPDPTEPWTITNDSIVNNVFSGSASQLYVRDYSGQFDAGDINLTVAGNQFERGVSQYMIVWGHASGNPSTFGTASSFNSGANQAANSDVSASQTMMGNPGGMPLPADVAAAIGQASGVTHMGVF